jgi:GNAT superfamily N-acetyltransferase
MSISLHLLTRFPPIGFTQLRAEAEAENFHHMARLAEEWETRSQRFQFEGEGLFAALLNDRLMGVGGVTRDPVLPPDQALRVRRLYVRREGRRQGVGRALVHRIARQAFLHAPAVVTNARTPPAARFFEALGFAAEDGDGWTHRLARKDAPV